MKFRYIHSNLNVRDLEKSIAFYEEALSLKVCRRVRPEDGRFELVYFTDGHNDEILELTWLADKEEPYNLGDNESHLAFRTADFEAAKEKHRAMGVICFENPEMGLYFISDPDGYWLEILPEK